MMKRGIVAVAAMLSATSCTPGDFLRLGPLPARAMVEGPTLDQCLIDSYRPGTGTLIIENLLEHQEACRSRVLVFRKGKALEQVTPANLRNTPGDIVPADGMPSLKHDSVTVWVLSTQYELEEVKRNRRRRARADIARAHQVFHTMQCGVAFQAQIKNADITSNPKLFYATCGDIPDLQSLTHTDPGALNVYVTSGVGEKGLWCGADKGILVTKSRDNESLAHEIGHAYALQHFPLSLQNVMVSPSYVRDVMTQGQCFRANLDTRSFLLRDVRLPEELECDEESGAGDCPDIYWPGGRAGTSGRSRRPPAPNLREALRRYLSCEECNEGELEALIALGPTVRQLTREVDNFANDQKEHLVRVYRSLIAYGREYPEVAIDLTEQEYLDAYSVGAQYLRELRIYTALLSLDTVEARRAIQVLLANALPESKDAIEYLATR